MKNGLHTDMLREKHGEIKVTVLRHDYPLREAKLTDERGVTLTYARTFLCYDRSDPAIVAIDTEIKKGGFIGETLEKHGYVVMRKLAGAFRTGVPPLLRPEFRAAKINVRLLRLEVQKPGGLPMCYGIIWEVGGFKLTSGKRFRGRRLAKLQKGFADEFGACADVNDPRKDLEGSAA